jgi:hypothetical protein
VRQVISLTESWFLSHFEPHHWGEIREKLEGTTSGESTTIVDSQGAPIPVARKAISDMEEMLRAAGGLVPGDDEPVDGEGGADSPDPS